MAVTGRKMIEGLVRYTNGKINYNAKARAGNEEKCAPPSPKVMNERHLFNAKCFKGGGQGAQSYDGIGQLWLVGKLDMPGLDETRLLAAARSWWNGREITFKANGYAVAKGERVSRSTGTNTKLSKPEREFNRYQAMLDDGCDYDAGCLADLMQPTLEGTPQDWVMRIVQTEALRYFQFPIALLACDDDYHKLEAAKRALVAMAGAEAVQKSAA